MIPFAAFTYCGWPTTPAMRVKAVMTVLETSQWNDKSDADDDQ